jgi:hypothetical protein
MKQALLIVVAFAATACHHGVNTEAPVVSGSTLRNMPGWYRKPPSDDKWLYSPATATSLDVQIAINKAQAEGRAGLATQLEVKYGALTRRFVEETGLARDAQLLTEYEQTYKGVVSEVLVGTRAKEQQFAIDGGVYRAWVLMELPVGEASKKLLEQLRTQEQMYTRFRATEAFKELNAEVDKYDKWKAGQKP